MPYDPRPIEVSNVHLDPRLEALAERLAENAHDVWARHRIAAGWRHGPELDEAARTHPSLVPYNELPEPEKELDRQAAMQTLRAAIALGCTIVPPDGV